MTESLITQHIDLWTSAIEAKSTAGRGSKNKFDLYGIKKLRELILELAVRGKLVPQDPTDEPASVLLDKIAAEKAQLIKEKKIKKTAELSDITNEEKPFELPNGWGWCRFNDIGDWGAGATPKRGNPEYYGGDIPWFKSGELSADFINSSEETVTQKALDECSLRYNSIGDVLVAMYGATIGKTSILSIRGTTNQAVCACTPFSGVANTYLLNLLKAYKSRLIGMGAGGAQPNISKEKIVATVVALPPITEQHRIVAKVDELMALCDQLEQQTLTSIDAHSSLVDTLLETLTNSADAAELEQNWVRISEHFDTLFTTEQSIDALKQTILQLAVMGKLVRQDPTDEPASVLLEKIAAEKAQLIKDKKIKKEKPLSPISDDEKPFELPQGWEWCRLGFVAILKGGFAYKSDAFLVQGGHQVIRMGNIRPNNLRIDENPVFIPDELAEDTADYEISAGDILLTMTGTKGKRDYLYSVLVPDNKLTNKKFYLNQRLCKLSTLLVDNFFIDYAIKNDLLLDAIYAKSTGTANQANIGMEAISHWLIPLPPLKEQNRIANAIKELNTLCDDLKVRTSKLKKMESYITDALIEQIAQ